ncbi:MAG TPA: diaminopimelate epimerase, partial [Anaerovoracaceae bacterium]|nr:diaminopimelate epimerase [Anaerovoracaceae bacterium]
FKMRFYNSDGSLGEMCGNGARCIARYGYENDLAGNVQKIETTAGMVIGYRLDTRKYKVKLNDISRMDLDLDIDVDGKKYTVSYVELGNPGIPHAVVYIEGLADADRDELFELGRKLRYHKHFEKGANVNFYDIVGEDQVVELTYERGVEDFTLACGTGTGSVVSVLTQQRKVSGNDVKVSVPGGELMIDIIKDGKDIKDIFLIGPTNIVAEGEILDEDL